MYQSTSAMCADTDGYRRLRHPSVAHLAGVDRLHGIQAPAKQ
jgi:hypothetical protein